MTISTDDLILYLVGGATVIWLIIATIKFIKKNKDPGSELDRQMVQQISFFILVILIFINVGMAFISAGVEAKALDERINPLARWIMHSSLELFGYFCLVAVGSFIIYTIYYFIYAWKYQTKLRQSKGRNKEYIEFRNRALRHAFYNLLVTAILLPIGIAGPFSNTLIVSFAYDQYAQFDYWFRELVPFMRSYDYTTIPLDWLKPTTEITEQTALLRDGIYYLPADYQPLQDMKLPLQAMCILFKFNVIAGLAKGLVSGQHILDRIDDELVERIEKKKVKKPNPSEKPNQPSSKKEEKKEEKKKARELDDDELETYLVDILEFYGYEGEELNKKVGVCMDNFNKEEYDEVIQEVSNSVSSITNKIDDLLEKMGEIEEDEYNEIARRACDSINRVFRKRVSDGGFGLPLSKAVYKAKYSE